MNVAPGLAPPVGLWSRYGGLFLLGILFGPGFSIAPVSAQTAGPRGWFRQAVKGQFPELHDPQHIPADQAQLKDEDPVCGLALGPIARCYPLRQLWYHHVVNESWSGQRLALTYCIMAHTATTVHLGETSSGLKVGGIEAGTLVLQDCQSTGALWPQIRPQVAVSGQTTGPQIRLGPEPVLTTWGRWRAQYPGTTVLAPIARYQVEYDLYSRRPQGARAPIVESTVLNLDKRLPPDEEVFGLSVGEDAVAWPLAQLEKSGGGRVAVQGLEVTVQWDPKLRHPVVTAPAGMTGQRARWFSWSSYYPHSRLVP